VLTVGTASFDVSDNVDYQQDQRNGDGTAVSITFNVANPDTIGTSVMLFMTQIPIWWHRRGSSSFPGTNPNYPDNEWVTLNFASRFNACYIIR